MRALCLLLALFLPLMARAGSDPLMNIEFGGMTRSYLLHLPNPLPNKPLPVVLVLHGGGGDADNARYMTGFDAEADRQGFIVVYPNGTDKVRPLMNMMGKPGLLTWNAGKCCGYAQQETIDDVGFLRAVVAQVVQDNAADPSRIYATGFSNGAMMAYRLACDASDLLAAIAPVSGIQEAYTCKPAHPVSVFHIHGAKDQHVPLKGGVGPQALEKEDRPPVQDSIDFWRKQDNCSVTLTSQEPDVDMVNYGACDAGTDVQYFVIRDGGHAWPGGKPGSGFGDKPSQAFDATQAIWEFFSKHSKQ